MLPLACQKHDALEGQLRKVKTRTLQNAKHAAPKLLRRSKGCSPPAVPLLDSPNARIVEMPDKTGGRGLCDRGLCTRIGLTVNCEVGTQQCEIPKFIFAKN